jgi:fructokinase
MIKKFNNNHVLCFGEMLWDRLPTGAKPGGAPMNVAIHLNAIGVRVSVASRIGKDKAGEDLKKFLEKSGLGTELVQTDEKFSTSEVLVHLDNQNNATYEICEPVAWDFISPDADLFKKAEKANVIINR